MKGSLFTADFLAEGIKETAAWNGLRPERLEEVRENLEDVFRGRSLFSSLNEADTEDKIILPVLRTLGWNDFVRQRSADAKARADVPDILLFPDHESYQLALAETADDRRYRYGSAFVESKKWERVLDRGDRSDPVDDRAPSTQMLRYLSRVEIGSNTAIRWGILTNGRLWRLYWQGARSRAEQFLEIDLAAASGLEPQPPKLPGLEDLNEEHWRRIFILMFRPEAFRPAPEDAANRSFHHIALDEGRLWEERVSRDLGQTIFENVFPQLIEALAAHDPEAPPTLDNSYLQTVRDAAFTWLYRILFILYAEDRNLLPANDPRYDDYSLRKIRFDIAARLDRQDRFSATAGRYFNHLKDLFRVLANGDDSIGVPPYNGGLFDPAGHRLLDRVQIPDADAAPLIDRLSRLPDQDGPKNINYRDLSVQQLGSVYERLLERVAVLDETGKIQVRPDIFARKGSGSYYTHEALVRVIIERTVGPLIAEKDQAFLDRDQALRHDRKPKRDKLEELQSFDPASRLLDLRICDPAMGSGHFLVSLVDYLADQVLQKMAEAEETVTWAPAGMPYRSPLADRITEIRERILESAQKNNWTMDRDQLDDRHIIRRMVLKRVIHGVDKNPMAVELAKVALWLHTFTVGAPLSFLDHHLRCGDSLYGERIRNVETEMRQLGALFQTSSISALESASKTMNRIAELTDADVAEVQDSKKLYTAMEKSVRDFRRFLDFWAALRWLGPPNVAGKALLKVHPGLDLLLQGGFGDIYKIVADGRVEIKDKIHQKAADQINDLLQRTREIARRERFLHWAVAFPGIWQNLLQIVPDGGFDAIIGNPPWDRMKLQEIEWFELRRPAIARAARASDRKKLARQLQKNNDPLWAEYLQAKAQAETAAHIARQNDDFKLLGGGDINLYSLFVERAGHLIKPDGIVGLLTPSGIAADKSAALFFSGIATTGRLAALFDFENKKFFFADIHASFKFSVIVFGGPDRTFPETSCAFYLHHTDELDDPDRCFPLTPQIFAAVNPNTGTAPVFKNRRDLKITAGIYGRFPILVDRREGNGGEKKAWPVSYMRMFDMTNDSHLFKTRIELDREGFYPVSGNLWKRGDDLYVPLYEGKMVQAYDHRAASVTVNPNNLHRPAQPVSATLKQHQNPQWLPEPQYWVNASDVKRPPGLDWVIAFKDVTAPTNIRTMIAAAVPFYGLGNTLPALWPDDEKNPSAYKKTAALLMANFNSLALDFLARQKVQGQHLNWYILEQLPVVPPSAYKKKIGRRTVSDHIGSQALHLSYTGMDLKHFAADQGHKGPPFIWDEDDRRHRLARLDALFFHLYGLDRDDAAYVLDQFPIVSREDETAFGRFLTRDLVLAYMNAVAAGDLDTIVSI